MLSPAGRSGVFVLAQSDAISASKSKRNRGMGFLCSYFCTSYPVPVPLPPGP